ncbi:venom serine protease inhibitor-like [Apis florea]|uniref:venom serine protease inhibitor-like n=1 Tax=Apis florea TaxID=7463 RepID=UPI0012FEE6DE|nr:venom serine protease inhibitor-like [Apis florea]
MSRLILLPFLFLAIFSVLVGGFVGRRKCKQDEIFTGCGALCQPTCAKPVYKGHCVKICVPGCLCPFGKVRNTNGKCVPLSKCFRKG